MALLSSFRKRVVLALAILAAAGGTVLLWRVARPGPDAQPAASDSRADGQGASASRRPTLASRRPSPPQRAGDARNPAPEPDASWDEETRALWRTAQDSAQDDIVRESAALKLAGRGDQAIVAALWELWRQGRLPGRCTWIRDLAAGGTESDGTPPLPAETRPSVPAAEVERAAARAVNGNLPLEARLEAVRFLGSAQSDQAVSVLYGLCSGELEAPPELRTAAFSALAAADGQAAVRALGQRLSQTEPPGPQELVGMLEALADEPHAGVRDVALPLLQHADPDVREEAAWLLAVNSEETTAEDMRAILQRLAAEDEPAVRRRLYGALDEDAAPYAEGIVAALRAEESVAVRLSGYQALAAMATAQPAGPVASLFDAQVVNELTDTALNAPEYQYRFEALVVLKGARTAGAAAALARVAAQASDPRIAQAAAAP